MKFSSALCYRMMPCAILDDVGTLEEALSAHAFAPCSPSQESSMGFIPPRAEHGALVEAVGGQLVLKIRTETRSVPASAIKRALAERVKKVEESTGRKPGRKETKELKEDISHELLPMAFSKHADVTIWIDRGCRWIVLDTASNNKADSVATLLVRAITDLTLSMVSTRMAPDTAMALWLQTFDAPDGFTIDRDCELRATNESKSIVRYANHALDIEEVRAHIAAGLRPTRLAMTFDDRVSFVLTDTGTLRSITFLEGTDSAADGKKEDAFDADVAIVTGELAELYGALMLALGGVGQSDIADAIDEDDGDDAAAPQLTVGDDADPVYAQAVELVRRENKASISMVQRHLKIGYNRAASLMERMEADGVVGPSSAAGLRSVVAA